NLLLGLFAEAAQRFQLPSLTSRFELVETADAELVVKDADFLESELRYAQKLEDAGRILLAQLLEVFRSAGAEDVLDNGGRCFPDARRFLQLARFQHLRRIAIERG